MQQQLEEQGYAIVKEVFSSEEVEQLSRLVESAEHHSSSFRKTEALFAIRRFLQEIPGAHIPVFTPRLKAIIRPIAGDDYFICKSIYFDKPALSNWFVAYHQDLTLSVANKADLSGYGPWSRKDGYFAVQPPIALLENILTLRIHLDDTDKSNGALKVVPGSHRSGVCRPEALDWSAEKEEVCPVPAGGVMLMRPLLLHASARSTGNKRRRVIHIELSNALLPAEISWSEKSMI